MLLRGGFDVCRQRSNSPPGGKSAEIRPTCPQICIRPSGHHRNGLVARGQGTTVPSQDNYQFTEFLQTSKPPPPPRAIGKTCIRPCDLAHFDSRENTTPLNQHHLRKCLSPRPETWTWTTQRCATQHIIYSNPPRPRLVDFQAAVPVMQAVVNRCVNVDDRHIQSPNINVENLARNLPSISFNFV